MSFKVNLHEARASSNFSSPRALSLRCLFINWNIIIFLGLDAVLNLEGKKSVGLALDLLKNIQSLSASCRGFDSSVTTRIWRSLAAIGSVLLSAMASVAGVGVGVCVMFDGRHKY